MPFESRRESEVRATPLSPAVRARHGSSRMLESYLGDIEYLVREQLWDEAAPLALALPHICAALADPDLHSSREQYLKWCESWVRPPQTDTSMSVPTPEAIYALAVKRGVADVEATGGIPMQALRQLRLRRLSRAAPARRRVSLADVTELGDEPAREACMALLYAVRCWYSESASLNLVVQSNLARLAVLR